MVAFPPVVEAPGPNAFISEHPRDVTEVHGDSIPYIIGINLDEGALKTARMYLLFICIDVYIEYVYNITHFFI